MSAVLGLARRLCDAARQPDSKALLGALLALAFLLPIWWLAGRWYGERLLEQERADAAIETSLRANALSSVINRRLARLQGLYAFVQVELSEGGFATQFEQFAAGLYAGTRGIRNLAVASGGLDFALRDASGRVFYGSEQVFASTPVLSVIRFPDDAWELAAAPLEGWQATSQDPLRVLQIGGLVIVGLLAGLVYLSVGR